MLNSDKGSVMFKVLISFLICGHALAFSLSDVQNIKWNDLDVVYIPDERFPTYSITIYFADGSLADGAVKGASSAAFSLMKLGTRRYSQKDIADNLEFFATDYGASVTHESTTFSVSGLVKDITPSMKKICHMFADADYPLSDLRAELKRAKEGIANMINDKGSLASHLFREISLKGSPISYPVNGKLRDLKKINRKILKEKLRYFNNDVKKRIYITGPKAALSIESVIAKDCGWTGKGKFVRALPRPAKSAKPGIVLVTVPKANQAQVRIGRLIEKNENMRDEDISFIPSFLGGGFTSRLMRVLRTENGLVYGAGAAAGMQKEYGRAFISTATANEKLEKLLTLTKETIDSIAAGNIPTDELERSQGLLASGYPFRFEKSNVFLGQLVSLDHLGKSYKTLETYPKRIYNISKKDLSKGMKDIYSWDKQTIFVLGTKSLKKTLSKFGKVKVIPYKSLM
jgi:zinc protease